jgi:hypothetical protein
VRPACNLPAAAPGHRRGQPRPAVRGRRPASPPGRCHARPRRRDWVTRKVGANGVISIAWQQFSVGKHRADEIDVHLTGELAQVWHRDGLLKAIVRDNPKEVRKNGPQQPVKTRQH